MKLTHSMAAFAACAALILPAAAADAGPKLKIPDFSHLRARAVSSEDITLDGFLLRLAQKFAVDDGDDDDEIAILRDIKSLRVRTFEFANEGEYSRADVESVRKQLAAPGWSALVQVHEREPHSDVDVFINTEGEKILGIAVIASEPREFTIVNIVGNIDIDKFSKLEGQFGVPKVNHEE